MSSYDQNLLDEAPKATRAQMQEGYNIDLLEQPPRRTPSVRNPPPQTPPLPAAVPLTPGIAETGSREKFGTPAFAPAPRKSFWRTRNGIITIIFIAVVVVGAVVGGAVGGTVGKKSNKLSTTGTASDGTSSSPGFTFPLGSSTSSAQTGNTQGVATSAPTTAANGGGRGDPLTTSALPTVFEGAVPSAAPSGQNIQMASPNGDAAGFSF